uniref:Uncharacterized protein n=1 Tax=Chromera velia CCMP2878 TaxID=1169474 RepID=A0A0G4H628_9ALVE|eukprot:Cvel_5743.t1-p1 / transcript=Cvel_5743.t1 / gene=Cvel_5743 / organism=Chromera_velia_CCMP2878 / gene_product=Proline-rich protein 2, putative / transcript_product=Proline-rich protein 2, putative / location=Cvel_scaffold272:81261-83429(-) / protein_length=723 / sequence_SO=supercontig / SO=protein_coding / is_pseudo=false
MEETALLPPPPTLDAFLERLNLLQTSVASQFQQQIEIVEKVLRAKKGHTGENSAAADEEVPLWCVRHEDVTVVESVEEIIREFSKKVRGKLGEVVSRHVEMDVGLLHEMGVYEMIRLFCPISVETTQKALCTFLDGTTNGDDLRLCLKVGADVNGLFDGHTALIRCVVADNREAAEMLVRDGVDLEGKIGRDVHGGVVVGDTAVIAAARLHRWGMLEWLIAEGANANAVTADGKKALEVACEAAEVQLSEGEESLFDSTVLPQENHPALRSAVQRALKALLEKTADVANFQSLSLVHFFCLHEFEDLLLLSLSKGVDINDLLLLSLSKGVDINDLLLLSLSKVVDINDLLLLSLSKGVDINNLLLLSLSKGVDINDLLLLSLSKGVDIDDLLLLSLSKGVDINDLLLLSLSKGVVINDLLLLSLSQGVDINDLLLLSLSKGVDINDLLLLSLSKGVDINDLLLLSLSKGVDINDLLLLSLSKGVDINDLLLLSLSKGVDINDLLLLSLSKGVDINDLLLLSLSKGVDINDLLLLSLSKGVDINDLLLLSLSKGVDINDLLLLSLSKGVDINAANPLDLTALDYAVQKRRVEFVKILVDNGATATGSIFLRAIPQARVQRDDFVLNVQRILEILLDRGVGVNSRVGTHSALHRAVQLGVIEIVWFLVQRGADLESRDELDRTPYQLARQIARYARSWQYHPVDRRTFPEMVDLVMPARPPSDQD